MTCWYKASLVVSKEQIIPITTVHLFMITKHCTIMFLHIHVHIERHTLIIAFIAYAIWVTEHGYHVIQLLEV